MLNDIGEQTNGDSKPSPKLHFIIVGGSLGGLSVGLALKSQGHDTTIMERNPEPTLYDQGAGIGIGGDTLAFFQRYDRTDRTNVVPIERWQYLDREGNVVHKKDLRANATSWDLAYHHMRANYDGIQTDYCDVPEADPSHGKAVHMHGCAVQSFELSPSGGVRVTYTNSTDNQKDPKTLHHKHCDILIGADGPSSKIRSILYPAVQRTYAGYVAIRGTVPESEVTQSTLATFHHRCTFFYEPSAIQILVYIIPGVNGTTEPGQRFLHFVYYTNFPENSPELTELMTDKNGRTHRITITPNLISPIAWEKVRQTALERLPPQYAELVRATKRPFIQAVTDVISPSNIPPPSSPLSGSDHEHDRVVLMGDALAGFRPHTVLSTSQACFDAMTYADYISGHITRDEWRRKTMGYARFIQDRGVHLGERSQFGERLEGGGWRVLALEELIADRDEAAKAMINRDGWPDWVMKL